MPRKYTDAQFWVAFWGKTRAEGDCLIWTAKKTKHTLTEGGPRPLVKVRGKWLRAYRVSLEMKLGRPIRHGYQANHICDRPLCVTGSHLYEGTQAQNVKDRDARGRGRWQQGEGHHSAKLTEAQVRNIRELLAAGISQQNLADQFGVSNQLISTINLGYTWKHIVDESRPKPERQ